MELGSHFIKEHIVEQHILVKCSGYLCMLEYKILTDDPYKESKRVIQDLMTCSKNCLIFLWGNEKNTRYKKTWHCLLLGSS